VWATWVVHGKHQWRYNTLQFRMCSATHYRITLHFTIHNRCIVLAVLLLAYADASHKHWCLNSTETCQHITLHHRCSSTFYVLHSCHYFRFFNSSLFSQHCQFLSEVWIETVLKNFLKQFFIQQKQINRSHW